MKNLSFFALVIVLLAAGGYFFLQTRTQPSEIQPVTTPAASPAASTPPIPASHEPYKDLLILESPTPGQVISSPLTIRGQARGPWYFEGSFPVVLTNWDGLIIAEGIATAQGEWMTEEFVPFEAELSFTADTQVSDRGTLILQKENPSGLPENDDAYEITVFFQ